MSPTPTGRAGLEERLVDDELLILDRERDAIHQLNPTASFIWSRCDGEHDAEAIASEMADRYGVDLQIVRNDVSVTITALEGLGLLAAA